MKKLIPIYALLTALALFVSVSCNSSDDSSSDEPVVISSNTLLKGFSLNKDDSVFAYLDSVFFTIDVDKRIVYNADSLPKGTKINRLVATLTYESSSTATIEIRGAETMRDTTLIYTGSSTDSIDFTGSVRIKVSAPDGISSRTYAVQLNVHKMEADSLYWNELAKKKLPSRTTDVKAQKTIQSGESLYCLLEEGNSYTLSTTENPDIDEWEKTEISFPFTPDIKSFNFADGTFFILSTDGQLYSSTDQGTTWLATGKTLVSIIAPYGNRILCISQEDGKYYHESFPTYGSKTEIEAEFPIKGMSQAQPYNNAWSTSGQIFILGGICQDGSTTGDVWGFDGQSWGKLSRIPMPARSDATLFQYVNYLNSGASMLKYPAWFCMGGRDENGNVTKEVYISYDNGVTWKKGDDLIQLPDNFEAFAEAQAYVYSTTFTRSANQWSPLAQRKLPAWWMIYNPAATRASTSVSSWDCPYIYTFGGVDANGTLMNNVWKGVINRLTFKPII